MWWLVLLLLVLGVLTVTTTMAVRGQIPVSMAATGCLWSLLAFAGVALWVVGFGIGCGYYGAPCDLWRDLVFANPWIALIFIALGVVFVAGIGLIVYAVVIGTRQHESRFQIESRVARGELVWRVKRDQDYHWYRDCAALAVDDPPSPILRTTREKAKTKGLMECRLCAAQRKQLLASW